MSDSDRHSESESDGESLPAGSRSVRDRSLLSHVQGLCKQGQTECVPEFVLRRFHRFCLDFALQQQLPHRTCILLQYRAINQ